MPRLHGIGIRRRRIGVALGGIVLALALSGCRTDGSLPSGASTSQPTSGRPVAGFLGDSYSAGYGLSTGNRRWTQLVSEQLNWIEDNYARSSTGYLAATGTVETIQCERDACAAFVGMLDELAPDEPDIVVVAGGINDLKFMASRPMDVENAVRATYQRIADELPDARIIAITPFYTAGPVPPELAELTGWIRDAASAVGATVVDGASGWLTDRPDLYIADGVHPSDQGQVILAQRVAASLEKQGWRAEG